LEFFIDIILKP